MNYSSDEYYIREYLDVIRSTLHQITKKMLRPEDSVIEQLIILLVYYSDIVFYYLFYYLFSLI